MVNSSKRTSTHTASAKPRHSLKLLSWNINHLRDKHEGMKTDIPEFRKLLTDHDIFCLQETKGTVNVSDFRCFNVNRKDSNSGGVCIGVRKSLLPGVRAVKGVDSSDMLTVKLNANFFNLDRDLNLVNVYDSPAHSSYKKRRQDESGETGSTIDLVTDNLTCIPVGEDIALVGDFNARTSLLVDTLPSTNLTNGNHQNHPEAGLEPNTGTVQVPDRCNKDTITNTNGKPFLQLVMASDLVILNGRTLGDIFGDYTCIQPRGASTVDYMCTSRSLYNQIGYFKVGDLTPYSDHKPLSAVIQLNSFKSYIPIALSANFTEAPKAYKWDRSNDESGSNHRYAIAQEDPSVIANVSNLRMQEVSTAADIANLNSGTIKIITDLASSITTTKSGKRTNKKKWFDWDCRRSKRELAKAAKKSGAEPFNDEARSTHKTRKRSHRTLLSRKKDEFLLDLNSKVNGNQGINWKSLKQLSEYHKPADSFDLYDLFTFYQFFDKLYNQQCKMPASHNRAVNETTPPPEPGSQRHESIGALNCEFSSSELEFSISKLLNNKSVSEDLVSNEMLKSLGPDLRQLILTLFNACLVAGVYPWTNSITTPLHKKGDKQDPDNYRAITVGSCLGKLFSSMLLRRLTKFRAEVCPDPPNQLGFRPGAQCNDHILTTKTLIEKYVTKKRGRLFACFVDYRKAFDTVCRQALLLKLSNMGVSGNFFRCLKNMYTNSKTKIKLVQKLSEAIHVTIGTEQGHPMSPELFKMFVHDLSAELDGIIELQLPDLNGFKISHLLWADDLILFALDAVSLQKLLDVLHDFVQKWELSINITKTNIMVFNTSSRILNCSKGFVLGDMPIQSVKGYCYLGIQFSLNGSFKAAMEQLSNKALRSYFSIRRTVDTRALSTSSMLNLLDSLVKPVATYACQIWLPSTNLLRGIVSDRKSNLTTLAPKDKMESTHLRILKWIMGVHKKTTNNTCYGDTGRLPLALSSFPQCFKYFVRASNANPEVSSVNTLLYHSFQEQKTLNLEWYRTWNTIINSNREESPSPPEGWHFKELYAITFCEQWQTAIGKQSKLSFYSSIKSGFGEEPYLALTDKSHRDCIARLRTSSHDLNIERGRYNKNTSALDRACRYCTVDHGFLATLEELPLREVPIIESEEHVLTECPAYHSLRYGLSEDLKSLLLLKNYSLIMYSDHIDELGKFLKKCFRLRNPPTQARTPQS